jgi:hypothetical protein
VVVSVEEAREARGLHEGVAQTASGLRDGDATEVAGEGEDFMNTQKEIISRIRSITQCPKGASLMAHCHRLRSEHAEMEARLRGLGMIFNDRWGALHWKGSGQPLDAAAAPGESA